MSHVLRFRFTSPGLLLPALLVLWAPVILPCYAQPAPPTIFFVYPAGGQQGQTVEVTVCGQGMKGATGVYVSGKGVTGKIVSQTSSEAPDKPKRGEVAKGKPKPWINNQVAQDAIRVSLTIAPDAELGFHDLRLLTPAGISKRCRFLVDELPQITTTQPNAEKTDAVPLDTLPQVANGQIYSGWTGTISVMGAPDRGYYRFTAKAGQTLIYEVQAQSLIPYMDQAVPGWMDACLTLFDADGHRLLYNDDYRFKPDPLLVHQVQKDGEYLLEVRDTIYRSNHDFIYRLRVGELPLLTHIFPLGGRRDSTVKIELHGINMTQNSLTMKIPADSPELRFVNVKERNLTTNSLPFEVGDLPEALETEPNDTLAQAQRLTLPVTVNGRIQRSGDADYFSFQAKEGEALTMEVHARRLDSPLDSILTLFDANGKKLDENDDPPPQAVPNKLGTAVETDQSFTIEPLDALVTHTADARLTYKFSKSGEYFLRLRDTAEKGGEDYAYRLTIAPQRPDFVLRLQTDSVRLGAGETGVLAVSVLRKDGFDAEIRLVVEGLPKGFEARGAIIPAGRNETQLTITAPADAPPGLYSPVVVGAATVDQKLVVHKAVPVESVIQAFYVKELVPTADCPLEVIPAGGYTLATDVPADKVLEIPQGGSATVLVKVNRAADAKFPINLNGLAPFQPFTPPPNSPQAPPGVTVKFTQLPADKDEVALTLNVPAKAPVGQLQNVIISGSMVTGKQPILRIAPALTVKVTPAEKASPAARATPAAKITPPAKDTPTAKVTQPAKGTPAATAPPAASATPATKVTPAAKETPTAKK